MGKDLSSVLVVHVDKRQTSPQDRGLNLVQSGVPTTWPVNAVPLAPPKLTERPHRLRHHGAAADHHAAVAKRPDDAVYVDFVQVGMGKTIVPPYSVRARDRAPVSTPLYWEEVEAFARRRGRTLPADEFAKYTIATLPSRLEREGDLWSGAGWKRQRLDKASAAAARRWSA